MSITATRQPEFPPPSAGHSSGDLQIHVTDSISVAGGPSAQGSSEFFRALRDANPGAPIGKLASLATRMAIDANSGPNNKPAATNGSEGSSWDTQRDGLGDPHITGVVRPSLDQTGNSSPTHLAAAPSWTSWGTYHAPQPARHAGRTLAQASRVGRDWRLPGHPVDQITGPLAAAPGAGILSSPDRLAEGLANARAHALAVAQQAGAQVLGRVRGFVGRADIILQEPITVHETDAKGMREGPSHESYSGTAQTSGASALEQPTPKVNTSGPTMTERRDQISILGSRPAAGADSGIEHVFDAPTRQQPITQADHRDANAVLKAIRSDERNVGLVTRAIELSKKGQLWGMTNKIAARVAGMRAMGGGDLSPEQVASLAHEYRTWLAEKVTEADVPPAIIVPVLEQDTAGPSIANEALLVTTDGGGVASGTMEPVGPYTNGQRLVGQMAAPITQPLHSLSGNQQVEATNGLQGGQGEAPPVPADLDDPGQSGVRRIEPSAAEQLSPAALRMARNILYGSDLSYEECKAFIMANRYPEEWVARLIQSHLTAGEELADDKRQLVISKILGVIPYISPYAGEPLPAAVSADRYTAGPDHDNPLSPSKRVALSGRKSEAAAAEHFERPTPIHDRLRAQSANRHPASQGQHNRTLMDANYRHRQAVRPRIDRPTPTPASAPAAVGIAVQRANGRGTTYTSPAAARRGAADRLWRQY